MKKGLLMFALVMIAVFIGDLIGELSLGVAGMEWLGKPYEIGIEVPQPNQIIIKGIDKQKVGQFAAEVREKRLPEPYKGKGIHYLGERIIRKEGKAGKGKK